MEVSTCRTQSSTILFSVRLSCIPVWTRTSSKPTLPYNEASTANITELNKSVTPGKIGKVVITRQAWC